MAVVKGFVTILPISIVLAIIGVFLVKRIGYRASLLCYLFIFGAILVWQSARHGLSVLDILVNFIIYFLISAVLLFLMTKPLEKWVTGGVSQPPTVRELCAQAVLESRPTETRELLQQLMTEADKQGRNLNIATIPL